MYSSSSICSTYYRCDFVRLLVIGLEVFGGRALARYVARIPTAFKLLLLLSPELEAEEERRVDGRRRGRSGCGSRRRLPACNGHVNFVKHLYYIPRIIGSYVSNGKATKTTTRVVGMQPSVKCCPVLRPTTTP